MVERVSDEELDKKIEEVREVIRGLNYWDIFVILDCVRIEVEKDYMKKLEEE